jgi:pimeloyl-[acyl-carrier protein] methyl ester esterase
MIKQKHFYLIRGLVREARHWDDFPEQLLVHFPEAKITTIDIPGAGEYHSSPTPLTIRSMTNLMRKKYLFSRGKEEQAILVAVSLGGMIGCEWIKRYSLDFEQGCLINTSFGGFSPPYHRLRPQALLHLMQVPFFRGKSKEAHIVKLICNNKLRYDQTVELSYKIRQDRPVSPANTIRQLLAAASFKVKDFTPQIPVYLIGSQNDRMVSISCSRAIAKKWNVPLIEHPQGGHDLTSDDPEWVAEQIKILIKS